MLWLTCMFYGARPTCFEYEYECHFIEYEYDGKPICAISKLASAAQFERSRRMPSFEYQHDFLKSKPPGSNGRTLLSIHTDYDTCTDRTVDSLMAPRTLYAQLKLQITLPKKAGVCHGLVRSFAMVCWLLSESSFIYSAIANSSLFRRKFLFRPNSKERCS